MDFTPGTQSEKILSAARALGSNPVFQLSTANQELFHSNMLFWLATSAKEHSLPLWDALINDGVSRTPISAVREKSNIDLMVTFDDDTQLGIENKIHSIATQGQLERYQEQLQVAVGPHVNMQLRLLSLFPPLFENPLTWDFKDYESVLSPLEQAASSLALAGRERDSYLVQGYRDLVDGLIKLKDVADPLAEPNEPMALDKEVERELQELRLLPLVRKFQASRIIQRVQQRLGPLADHSDHEIQAGMSNSTGVMEHFVRYANGTNKGRRIGWQVQSGQFRLVAIRAENRDRVKAVDGDQSPLAEAVNGFINTDSIRFRVPLSSRSRKPWCKYGEGFVYRYVNLPDDITTDELVDLCVKASHRAIEWAERDETQQDVVS